MGRCGNEQTVVNDNQQNRVRYKITIVNVVIGFSHNFYC